jgi:hypothetical protein
MRPLRASLAFLRPVVRLTRVLPTLISVRLCLFLLFFQVLTYSRLLNVEGALIEYQSLRVKGSWVLFLRPFLPFDNLLFLQRM